MSPLSYDKIPFGVKASNVSAVANFSSTLDDSYIFVIANNCNTPVYNNANSYDTVYNSFENAALYGVNIITGENNQKYHEAYIGIKSQDTVKKLAQFNKNNATISANVIPLSDSVYNIGNIANRWNNVYASHIHGNGQNITNINLADKTTNDLQEGTNNLYYTEQRFDERLGTKSADNINDGITNKFIVNNNFQGDLNINGTLSACNLVIEGDTSVLNTTLYTTEKFEIINNNTGPAFKVTQIGNKDIMQIFKDTNSTFIIDSNGNVGINNAAPQYKLDVQGISKASFFMGDGENISNINLSDKTTKYLLEDPDGSNLYYTPERVGIIAEASNINVSNYILNIDQGIDGKFDNRLLSKTLDDIKNGTSNRYIVNGIYNGSVSVTQTLTAYDLNVTNSFYYNKIVEQTVNQASKTEIINTGVGPALKVVQNDNGRLYNLLEAYVGTDIAMSIIQNGYVGINKLNPAYNLDVNGTIRASLYKGDGSNITNINLSDKTTRYLKEDPNGSNLYFTAERVAIISDGSNANTSNYVVLTSNILTNKIASNEINTCNYIKTSSNLLISYINDTKSNIYSDVQITSNLLVYQILSNENDTCNYIKSTCNLVTYHILSNETNTSNYIQTTSNLLANKIINNDTYIKNIENRLQNITTNDVVEGNQNKYYTDARFDTRLLSKSLDDIKQGTSNKYIFKNNYQGNLNIEGTLSACNLVIEGDTTVLNTTLYTTERFEIINQSLGPAFKITQINDKDILQISKNTENIFIIDSNGNIGIRKTNPQYSVDLNGTINASFIKGNGNLISNINLSDKTTKYLLEDPSGSNLYYTPQRVGIIANASNIHTSNYIIMTSNLITNDLKKVQTDTNSYILNTANNINKNINSLSTQLSLTSNLLAGNTLRLNIYMSNYVEETSNNLNFTINNINNITSNYIINTSNEVTQHILYSELNSSNYTDLTSNLLALNIINTSNFILFQSDNNLDYLSNTSNTISTRITNLNTNEIKEGNNNLYYTNDRFDQRLISKNLDNINQGTSNTFIVNNNYKGSLNIEGTLSACNLIIEGDTTVLNTTVYQTEKLEIMNNGSGPVLKITQTGNENIFEAYDDNNIVFRIIDGGKIGINKENPIYDLDINGTTQSSMFKGDGRLLTNINFTDRSTSLLVEGSNQYYTPARVGLIAEASNLHSSNYTKTTSNIIIQQVLEKDYNTSNYININSNIITKHVLDTCNYITTFQSLNNTNNSNYIYSTSNIIVEQLIANKINTSNYLNSTSNNIINTVQNTCNNLINFINLTSNIIRQNILSTDLNVSNYINITSNNILVKNIRDNINQSNYTFNVSNILNNYINVKDINNSNYVYSTSNLITINLQSYDNNQSNNIIIRNKLLDINIQNIISYSNQNLSNYVLSTSNKLYNSIKNVEYNQSNFSLNISNILLNNINIVNTNQSNYTFSTSNIISTLVNFYNKNLSNLILTNNNNQSNYVKSTSNLLAIFSQSINNNQSNYTKSINYSLSNIININNNNQSNYTWSTSSNIYIHVRNLEKADISINNNITAIQNIIFQLINNINENQNNTSNYILHTSNVISKRVTDTSNFVISEIKNNSNVISNRITDTSNFVITQITDNSNVISNRITDTSNFVITQITDNSNVISNRITDTSNFVISEIKHNSNVISDRITDTSNFVISEIKHNSNVISNRIQNLTLDQIYNGTSNKYIIDNKYNDDLFIKGTLVTCNLIVDGTSTTLNTTTYQTERLEIVSSSFGPALTIQQYGNYDILSLYDDDNIILKVCDGGNIGINNNNPNYALDVNGTTFSTYFIGDGGSLYNVNFADRTTDLLIEGSNLYYTSSRVGIIATASNIHASNLVHNVSNLLNNRITNTSNNLAKFSLQIYDLVAYKILDVTNRLYEITEETSNTLVYAITNNSNIFTTSLFETSNKLLEYNIDTSNRISYNLLYTSNIISNNLTNTCNYLYTNIIQTSNSLIKNLYSASNVLYNELNNTSNILHTYIYNNINLTSNTLTNDIINTSNILYNYIYNTSNNINERLEKEVSQLNDNIHITSNIILNTLLYTSNDLNISIILSSNNLYNNIINVSANLDNTSNDLYNNILNVSANLQNTSNDLYNNIVIVSANLDNTSNDLYKDILDISKIIDVTSNNLYNDIQNVSVSLNNTSNDIYEDIFILSKIIDATSNDLYQDILNVSVNLNTTSNDIYEYIIDISSNFDSSIKNTSNEIYDTIFHISDILADELSNISNIIYITSNNLELNLKYSSNELNHYITNISNLTLNISEQFHNSIDEIEGKISSTSNIYENLLHENNIKIDQTSNNLIQSFILSSNILINKIYTLSVQIENQKNTTLNYINTKTKQLSDLNENTSNKLSINITNTSNQLYNNIILYKNQLNDIQSYTINTSNKFTNEFDNVYNKIIVTSNTLNTSIKNASNIFQNIEQYVLSNLQIVSNNIIYTSNQLNKIIEQSSNNLDVKIADTSNILQLHTIHIYDLLLNKIVLSSNNLDLLIRNSSNDLYNILYNTIKKDIGNDIYVTSNLLLATSNALYSSFYSTSNKFYNDLLSNLYNDMVDVINLSNYVSTTSKILDDSIKYTSNIISRRVNTLTADEVKNGNVNRFIVNDCYERDVLFKKSLSATSVISKSVINFGGIDIYNDTYNTPSLYIVHDNDADVVDINMNNIHKFIICNNGYIGINTGTPEFDFDVNGILNATRLSGDGGLLTNVNLSDKTTDDILEGTCNLFFREERLDEMIMSKSLDMFQSGSNMSIIRNGIYDGSLLITGQLTVNSLKVLDVNGAYISSNTSNYGNGIYNNNNISLEIISNLDYDIKNISNVLIDTINNLHEIEISSLDQVGNGTSNKYIRDNVYNSSLNVLGRLQAEYVGGDGMFITNVNLLDKTTDDLKEGSKYYYSEERFNNSIQNITTDYMQNGFSNRYIVNGIYEGDLIITGDLTVSRVKILDIFANVLNSNYEADYYNSSNSYVQSLASFIRNINANLENEMKFFDHKLNLIMTCNMDETILGIIANDSNVLLNKFSETINYVNSNVAILSNDVYYNISNLIDYVNENVSKVEYYNYYTLDGSNIEYVMNIVNSSNEQIEQELNSTIKALSTTNIKEGINLYYTPKRVGAIAYASNLHASNYIDSKASILHDRINLITLDEIASGCNNSYIRNNVYDGYLIVTGGIITNNVVISDLQDNELMLSSNAKELLASSSFKNNSNSFMQNLINKLNIQNDIIDNNNVIINILTSNLEAILNKNSNVEYVIDEQFAYFYSNIDELKNNNEIINSNILTYQELIYNTSNKLELFASNVERSINDICLLKLNSNNDISIDNINSNLNVAIYNIQSNVDISIDNINNNLIAYTSIVDSNIFKINDLQNENKIQQEQINVLSSNLQYSVQYLQYLESLNTIQQNDNIKKQQEINILSSNFEASQFRIQSLESISILQQNEITRLNSYIETIFNKLDSIENLPLITEQITTNNTEKLTSYINNEILQKVNLIEIELLAIIDLPTTENYTDYIDLNLLNYSINDMNTVNLNIQIVLDKVLNLEQDVYSLFEFSSSPYIPSNNIPFIYYTSNIDENEKLNMITSNIQTIKYKINRLRAYIDETFIFSS